MKMLIREISREKRVRIPLIPHVEKRPTKFSGEYDKGLIVINPDLHGLGFASTLFHEFLHHVIALLPLLTLSPFLMFRLYVLIHGVKQYVKICGGIKFRKYEGDIDA